MVRLERHVATESPTANSMSCLVCFTEDLQDAVIGVQVIPQGPPEGDHMANGRIGDGCTRNEMTTQNTLDFS